MQKHINALRDHTIVTGFGRMGKRICEELQAQHSPFVVIDREAQTETLCLEKVYPCVIGDAEEDEILERAGIKHAKALIAATGNDAANAFIVMSARALNPQLYIVARAEEDAAMRKLRKAGANQTINPYAIAGQRLVNMVLRPTHLDSKRHTLHVHGTELSVQEVIVDSDSHFADKTIKDLALRTQTGVSIIAVVREGVSTANPAPDYKIEANDVLILLGSSEQFAEFKNFLEQAIRPKANI